MKRFMILMIFTTITLIGMESSGDSRTSPPLPPTPTSSEDEMIEDIDIESLSQQALSLFFEYDEDSLHTESFSYELSRRIHPHVQERNGNLRRLMQQRSMNLSDSQDRPPTPEQSLRKELRDIVVPTLTALFNEKEKEHAQDRKKLTAERLKFRLALLTAGTTICTTAAATITAIVVSFNQ